IAVLASLNLSAQVALPEWVRGRGLAMFVTVFFGAMTIGSAAWGQIAGMAGVPAAHFMAAAGAVLALPLTWRWKLQTGGRPRPDPIHALARAGRISNRSEGSRTIPGGARQAR